MSSRTGKDRKKSYPVSCEDINMLIQDDCILLKAIDTFLQKQTLTPVDAAISDHLQEYHTLLLQVKDALQHRMHSNATCFSFMVKEIAKQRQCTQNFFICARCQNISKLIPDEHDKSHCVS